MMNGKIVVPLVLGAFVIAVAFAGSQAKEEPVMNQPSDENIDVEGLEVATLGGGCFWCLEPVFEELQGVKKAEVGYAGGDVENPSYEAVCSGETGHAEVVQVWFDPEVISFRRLLEVFFDIHDPTTLNRQGADVGTQYRSIILYRDGKQKEVAEKVIREIDESAEWDGPVVTQVEPFEEFYRAEDYHQEYFEKNPNAGYCRIVIAPKMKKFRTNYAKDLKIAGEEAD
jgi:peptide-methionine (S)-S-oxide reductase